MTTDLIMRDECGNKNDYYFEVLILRLYITTISLHEYDVVRHSIGRLSDRLDY